MSRITIGTRASKLAMIQTEWVTEYLHRLWPTHEIVLEPIRTTGDRVTNVSLAQLGGDGVFVKEIERALAERHVDLAIHSLKDLPTAPPEGLQIFVAGQREDVRDVLVLREELVGGMIGRAGDAFPVGRNAALRIGTCSLRRTAQLRAHFPNVEILPLRGNVDTRIRKLDAGDYDGIVVAAAGLHRMGLHEKLQRRLVYFPVNMMLPAPGQGALALEIRDEPEMRELIAPLNDSSVQATTAAERMFMRQLGAGCYLPVAAHGRVSDGTLTLQGLVISLDGQRRIYVQQQISWKTDVVVGALERAERLGIALAEQALEQGAAEIIQEINGAREQERQHA